MGRNVGQGLSGDELACSLEESDGSRDWIDRSVINKVFINWHRYIFCVVILGIQPGRQYLCIL